MRIVKRNRYYCDFCKKAGGSGGHMKRHEQSCTLNPNRVCRVCKMVDGAQKPIAELVALLPKFNEFTRECDATDAAGQIYQFEMIDSDALTIATNAALPRLREACDNCPACIMAALRQAKIPVPLATEFNFTKEMKAIWDEITSLKLEECGGLYP